MANSIFIFPANQGSVSFTAATFGEYVIGSGPFVTASGHRYIHSEGGGGGGSVYENTCFGYDAGAALAGTAYANVLIGKNAGKALNGTSPNAVSNVMVGYGSGELVTTGAFLTLLGTATGGSLTTAQAVTHVGYHAGNRTTGTGNTYVGNFCGRGAVAGGAGISNTAVGDSAMNLYTTADSNAAFGISALESLTSGDNNTALGSFSLRNGITTASGSIGIGYFAGAFETGSSKFFVNNVSRANETGDRTLSLLYGIMGAAVTDQSLTVNAKHVNLSLAEYADNAAAVTGGLVAGELYKTSGAVKVVT